MSDDDIDGRILRAIEFLNVIEYAEYENDIEWWNTHLMAMINKPRNIKGSYRFHIMVKEG